MSGEEEEVDEGGRKHGRREVRVRAGGLGLVSRATSTVCWHRRLERNTLV